MERLSERKIILVKRKTRLEELVAKYNTVEQAKFYIEHLNADFTDYLEEDFIYKNNIEIAKLKLERLGRLQVLERQYIPNFIFGQDDLIVVIGQDGLVANTLKYLDNQCLIGVNPDPKRWDGVLLPFEVNDIENIVVEVLSNKRKVNNITMAKATLNDGQILYSVNDFYIGQKTHISSRYSVSLGNHTEQQSSSGIIVSTGLGSTGWFKSIVTGASVVTNDLSNVKLRELVDYGFPRDSDYLYFSVREPFPSKTTETQLVFGKINADDMLLVNSLMPENGVIFSDGIESDFIEFNSGKEARITVAEKKGKLVI
jgi:NAD kinase